MKTSIKRVKTSTELEQAIEDAQAEGWKLENSSDNVASLTKNGTLGGLAGHTLVFITTCWFTFGLGNVAFALYRYISGKHELRIKMR